MTSVQNLFTNSTNRFSPSTTSPIKSSPPSFTPLIITSSHPKSITSIPKSSIPSLLQPFPQTYSQLQEKYLLLTKQLAEAGQQKQLMTMLFQKIFSIEAGHQQRIKKRLRRRKTQIQAKHACKLCSKIYSSLTSLARHAKLKHSYTILEPPLREYQIPPQPNSVVDYCEQSKPDDTELNERNQKRSEYMNDDDSQKFENDEIDSSEESCSSSESHESTPFQKGLS